MKKLALFFALLLTCSFPVFAVNDIIVGPVTLTPGTQTFSDLASCETAAQGGAVGTFACGVSITTSLPCPALPASTTQTQTVACPAGFTGSWTQTNTTTYAAAPKPACSTKNTSPWLPVAAPASACTAIPLPTQGYIQCAVENATCKLPVTVPATPGMTVIYGAGTVSKTWSPALHVTNDLLCANTPSGPFIDPDYGIVKSCWVKYDAPVAQDMGNMVQIDMTKLAPITTTAENFDARQPVPRNPDGTIPNCCTVLPASDTVGAFRVNCTFGKMIADDPLVYPGQSGASHLHTVFGNLGFDAFLTSANQRSAANLKLGSTCGGGTLNMSNYWVPTMIDFGSGAEFGVPLVPSGNNVYYKRGYYLGHQFPIVAVPNGLHVITGNAKNVNPAGADHSRFICMGPKGENPGWQLTIDAAMVAARLPGMGNCAAGSDFTIEVDFPQCWDGVNLDSPNHTSHMADPLHDNVKGFYCPADHPVALPVISFNVHYPVLVDGAPDYWRFSSDAYDPKLPRGLSSHGDYFFGWDTTVLNLWTTNCIQASNDCHDDLLGDGTTLY